MPNVEMIDSALQSADGPKTFDELVPVLEDAGYVVETKPDADMSVDTMEAPEDKGPDEAEDAIDESMDMLQDMAPPGAEPVVTSVSGVMRDKARNASKNALKKHSGDYA